MTLSTVEQTRLTNFKSLHGTSTMRFYPLVGALALRYSAALGTPADGQTLIDEATADAVESAYGLPKGWLSIDHDDDLPPAP